MIEALTRLSIFLAGMVVGMELTHKWEDKND